MYYIGDTFLHQNAIVSGSSTFPTTKSGIDCGLYDSLALELSLAGTATPTWGITPGYWSDSLNAYCASSALTINAGTSGGGVVLEVDTLGASDVYLLCINTIGTNPTITVYAKQIRKG